MQFTVDARTLYLALKSLTIRRNMQDVVLIEAQSETLTLRTRTIPSSRWVLEKAPFLHTSLSLTDGVSIQEEGRLSLAYQSLLNALKGFEGMVTVRQQGYDAIIEPTGDSTSTLKRHTPVKAVLLEQHFVSHPPEVGTTYTHTQAEWKQCPTCTHSHREEHTDVYRVTGVVTQRTHVARECLAAMLTQVMWAVGDERYDSKGKTGIALHLSSDVLSLKASDGRSAVVRSETQPDGGSWEHALLVPAKELARAVQMLPKHADVVLEAVLTQRLHVSRDNEPVSDAVPFLRAEEVLLYAENRCITLSLMNGSVHDYQYIFTRTRETQVICATSDLLKALNAVEEVAKEDGGAIWLQVGEMSLGVEVRRGAEQDPALHEIPLLSPSGGESSVPMSWYYLYEAVKAAPSTEVIIEIDTTPGKVHVVLRANGGQGEYQCALGTLDVA